MFQLRPSYTPAMTVRPHAVVSVRGPILGESNATSAFVLIAIGVVVLGALALVYDRYRWWMT